jgi:hypothetical protein
LFFIAAAGVRIVTFTWQHWRKPKKIIELRLSDYCHQSRLSKELKSNRRKDKVNYLLLSDSNGELAKAMGIAFQAPENYKTILAKDQMG